MITISNHPWIDSDSTAPGVERPTSRPRIPPLSILSTTSEDAHWVAYFPHGQPSDVLPIVAADEEQGWLASGSSSLPPSHYKETSINTAKIESWFSAAEAELIRYEKYRAGWDGYDGVPFSADVIDNALSILQVAEFACQATEMVLTLVTTGPASDGSLDVEIRTENRKIIFTINPNDDVVEILAVENSRTVENKNADPGEDVVGRWILWVVGQNIL